MRLLQMDENGQFSLTNDIIDNIRPYAILSHTWGDDDDEVSFKDLTKGPRRRKHGYKKLRFCADQAARDGLEYFWVDTCCIDKSNNTELQEAINSMFRWYRDAAKCYVYLADVSTKDAGEQMSIKLCEQAFRESRWFTRGWTLQELIAPRSVEFFCSMGKRLGDKISLEPLLEEITGISLDALRGRPLSEFSIIRRMSWAEGRQTKREEDKIYCLMGIFNVHMPLIYSEGADNALRRLEEQIEKHSNTTHNISRTLDSPVSEQPTIADTFGSTILQYGSLRPVSGHTPLPSETHQDSSLRRPSTEARYTVSILKTLLFVLCFFVAVIAWLGSSMNISNSTLCTASISGEREILIQIPSALKIRWLTESSISLNITREKTTVDTEKMYSTDEGIALVLAKSAAYGVLNISVVTTTKPIINETLTVDFGIKIDVEKAHASETFKSHPKLTSEATSESTTVYTIAHSSSKHTTIAATSKKPDIKCQDLFQVASAGDAKSVKYLLNKGCPQNIRDHSFRTPLHLAAINGNFETVQVLLQREGAAWFAEGDLTPLHLAAKYGHSLAVKALSQYGRSWSGQTNNWERDKTRDTEASEKLQASSAEKTGLQLSNSFYLDKTFSARELAVIFGHRDSISAFPSFGFDEIGNAFSCACLMGDVGIVELLWEWLGKHWDRSEALQALENALLATGDQRHRIFNQKHDFPLYPLQLAIMSGNVDLVALLLEYKFERIFTSIPHYFPKLKAEGGRAARTGSVPILKLIARHGHSLVKEDETGRTPLSYAVEYNRTVAVYFLLDQDYDENKSSWREKSKKELYFGSKHPESIKMLFEVKLAFILKGKVIT